MAQDASRRLHEIAARLRAEGAKGMQRELAAELRAATRPLVAEVRGAAFVSLPKRGGLNEEQGNQPIRVTVVTGANTAGVRIRTRTPGSNQTDKGYVRHPTPALLGYDRSYWHWVEQKVPRAAGWWSKTLARESPKLTPVLIARMNKIARRIQGGRY